MKLPCIVSLLCFISGGVLLRASKHQPAPAHAALRSGIVPPELATLASRADQKQGWPALVRYANAARNQEYGGLAYFVLGYREYQAHAYEAAGADLDRAIASSFSLTDFAVYYRAAVARDGGHLDLAARQLTSFSTRFPKSTLRIDALRLETFCQITYGDPDDAIRTLTAAPEVHSQMPLEYLLAEAYRKAGQAAEAAREFQEIYYRSPGSPEAAPSGAALQGLQLQLGSAYPLPSEDLRTARANALEKEGRFAAALDDYSSLMRDDASSASAGTWRLGRDRCLMGLGRANEAVLDLASPGWPTGEIDAQRSLFLVRERAHSGDEPGMKAALEGLAQSHPGSPSYASALDSASFFFLRRGDWLRANDFNQVLAQQTALPDLAAKAAWETAWAAYLSGHGDEARQRFAQYLAQHPSSYRTPPALYWLGRLAESDRPGDAKWFYTVLQKASGYYPLRAEERLKALAANRTAQAGRQNGAASTVKRDEGAVEGLPVPAGIDASVGSIPPLPADASFCSNLAPTSVEKPAVVLAALALDDLATRYIRALLDPAVSGSPKGAAETASLHLALARIERDRQKFEDATLNAKRALPNYFDYEFSSLPFDFWNLLYPEAFWDLVRQDARLNRVDPYLVMGLIRQESGFNPKAVSGPGARGLMQLRPPTANQLAREQRSQSGKRRSRSAGNLSNPNNNLRAGCRYLSEMIQAFNGSVEEALAAYNAGPERVREWLTGHSYPEPAAFVESIPFPETRAYVEAVLRDQAIYKTLLSGAPKFKRCTTRP